MKTVNEWFSEFSQHLENDKTPSAYFFDLVEKDAFPARSPFDLLYKLKYIAQNPKHHPEGDVFIHTMLVVDNAAKIRSKSRRPEIFMWSALLHDIGKIPATKVRKGRLTAYDHDKLGSKMSFEFLKKCGCDEDFCREVSIMVRWHMQSMFVVRDMPYADIEGMAKEADIDEIAMLALCDRLGRGQTSNDEIRKEEQTISLFVQKTKDHLKKSQKSPSS